MDYLYNKQRDISPVLEEPVLLISHCLETGIIPSGGVDDDSYDYDNTFEDTSHVIGRVVDPFDAIEVNKTLEQYNRGLKSRKLSSEKRAAFEKAVAEAVKASQSTPQGEKA